jgi:1-acyl-sn-glycerol-3-phosphate acyltransferase
MEGLEHLPAEGGVILAVCHVSHLDPVVVSTLLPRRIGWVARIEFYRSWMVRAFLHSGGAFPVNRKGAALPTVREGLRRLRRGEVVGIFPEGEIMRGRASVLRGGRLKRGACLLAARSGCPVVPVVVLGTDRLGNIGPWLPAKRGRLWLRIGPAMRPDQEGAAKISRAEFAGRLEAEFVKLFVEGQRDWGLPESIVP